jgi:hypothetical protein
MIDGYLLDTCNLPSEKLKALFQSRRVHCEGGGEMWKTLKVAVEVLGTRREEGVRNTRLVLVTSIGASTCLNSVRNPSYALADFTLQRPQRSPNWGERFDDFRGREVGNQGA